jgi:hypothetical protein
MEDRPASFASVVADSLNTKFSVVISSTSSRRRLLIGDLGLRLSRFAAGGDQVLLNPTLEGLRDLVVECPWVATIVWSSVAQSRSPPKGSGRQRELGGGGGNRTRLAPNNSRYLATEDVVPVWGHYPRSMLYLLQGQSDLLIRKSTLPHGLIFPFKVRKITPDLDPISGFGSVSQGVRRRPGTATMPGSKSLNSLEFRLG